MSVAEFFISSVYRHYRLRKTADGKQSRLIFTPDVGADLRSPGYVLRVSGLLLSTHCSPLRSFPACQGVSACQDQFPNVLSRAIPGGRGIMYRGSNVALVTPMSDSGKIDFAALERLLEFHVSEGTDGVVIAGTTGESPTLETDELEELVAFSVRTVAGRIPVIAGSGTNSTRGAAKLSRIVEKAGADAALVVTPYYNKPGQTGLRSHYVAVAESVDLPIILYNVPGRTAVDLLPATVAALAEVPNIVGLKEATPGVERLAQLRELCPDDFCLLSGDDATSMDFVLAGGDGVISVTANVAPRLMHGLCVASLAGESKKAASINDRLQDLHTELFAEANPIPVKWAVARMGLMNDGIRLPMTRLDEIHHESLAAAMARAGVG